MKLKITKLPKITFLTYKKHWTIPKIRFHFPVFFSYWRCNSFSFSSSIWSKYCFLFCHTKTIDFVSAQFTMNVIYLFYMIFALFLLTVCIHAGVGMPIPIHGATKKHHEKCRRSSGQQFILIRFDHGHCCLLFQTHFRLFADLWRN